MLAQISDAGTLVVAGFIVGAMAGFYFTYQYIMNKRKDK